MSKNAHNNVSEEAVKNFKAEFLSEVTESIRKSLREATSELAVVKNQTDKATAFKDSYIAKVCHEIKTPLSGVHGMVELLQHTDLTPEQQEYTDIIQSSASMLLSVSNDIIDFAKIKTGSFQLNIQDFDLRSIVEKVCDVIAPLAHAKKIELSYIIPHNLPVELQGDETRLGQVLLNLLNNAVKFTDKGEICLFIKSKEITDGQAKLLFKVTDTGKGISSSIQEKLLQDSVSDSDYEGSGLGLIISQEIVDKMNGYISFKSEEGRGSTFRFNAEFNLSESFFDEYRHDTTKLKGTTVLIFDGFKNNRQSLYEILSCVDCKITVALDLKEFKEFLNEKRYDFLFLDEEKLTEENINILDTVDIATHRILMKKLPAAARSTKQVDKNFELTLTKPLNSTRVYGLMLKLMTVDDTLIQHDGTEDSSSQILRILLVEDNPMSQKVTSAFLESKGFKCDIVSNGEQAITAFLKHDYSLVLMDCFMPVMDGFRTTEEIRKFEGDVFHTPIFALTGHDKETLRGKCEESGMDGCLHKPLNLAELENTINDTAASAKKRMF